MRMWGTYLSEWLCEMRLDGVEGCGDGMGDKGLLMELVRMSWTRVIDFGLKEDEAGIDFD